MQLRHYLLKRWKRTIRWIVVAEPVESNVRRLESRKGSITTYTKHRPGNHGLARGNPVDCKHSGQNQIQ